MGSKGKRRNKDMQEGKDRKVRRELEAAVKEFRDGAQQHMNMANQAQQIAARVTAEKEDHLRQANGLLFAAQELERRFKLKPQPQPAGGVPPTPEEPAEPPPEEPEKDSEKEPTPEEPAGE